MTDDARDASGFRRGFARALREAFPNWTREAAMLEREGEVEICPQGWTDDPLVLSVSHDTVTMRPLIHFGLDYITTASEAEAEQEPSEIFARPIGDLQAFVERRAALVVVRQRFFGLPAGWSIGFVAKQEANRVRARGGRVIVWPAGA